jgi:hypothetical protein
VCLTTHCTLGNYWFSSKHTMSSLQAHSPIDPHRERDVVRREGIVALRHEKDRDPAEVDQLFP